MVYVMVTLKVVIRASQRLVVALMIILFCQMTCMHLSIPRVNFVSLDALNRITCHLHFRVIFPKENVCSDEVSHHQQIIEKFVWDDIRAQTFTSLMCTDETCAVLDEAISLIDLDIDKALEIFNNCTKEKAECMKKQIRIKKKMKKIGRELDEWFDWECKVGRRNVRRLLKKYRRSLLADDRNVSQEGNTKNC